MIAGRYELVREIGRGGMGAVHLARDQVLGREVAVKRIGMLPGTEDPDLARAEREARIAAMLHHPNVVSVFDLVEEDDRHWLVMEYVPGVSLAQRIREHGPLDHATAAAVMAQVADALVAAHAAGITHRDVKPSNVLLTEDDTPKLGDFGIARKEADPSLTQTGLVTGSPAYLAPEVASGSPAGPAADVWSLGATLFHVLSGKPPYDVGDNVMGGLYKIVNEEPPRLAEANAFDDLLRHTMARDPAQRWPMGMVRDRLREIARSPEARGVVSESAMSESPATATEVLAPVPAAAATPTTAEPAPPEPSSRSPLLWAAAALVVLLVGIGIAIVVDRSRDEPTAAGPSTPTTSTTTTSEPSEPTKTPQNTRRDVTDFVNSYMSMVTSDPQAAFALLTPEFQRQSGGYSGYIGWWSTIASARADNITVDPEALTVSYDAAYETKKGTQTGGPVTLQLERSDDGYLIAGEA